MKTKTAVSATGEKYEYVHSDNPPSGAMKEVYFSPDRSYVIGFFKSHPGANGLARLESITEDYRSDIFNQQGGDYWKEIFCWPEKMVMGDGRIGVVVPTYAKDFFFQHDPKLKGNEKQGKWFASAQLMRILDATERGDFLKYLQISLKLARGVRRLHAADAIKEVQNAGIQVVMVTGDRKETAVAISKEAGLVSQSTDVVLTSAELAGMSDEEIKKILPNLRVVARALPTDKSRLVRLAQELNLVVGMTGDGVNDSPALKKADVGFAMGSGTEVAKEAGDITILDDNFASIEKAILYGRTMFKSIRKFLIFQLTVNVAAVLTCFLAPMFGENVVLTVIQLLFVNLAMDTLAAIAFGSEPALKEFMKDRPIPRGESIVTKKMFGEILLGSFYITAVCLAILFIAPVRGLFGTADVVMIKSAVFATFMMAITFNGFNARTTSLNLFANIDKNENFLIVMASILAIQYAFVTFGGEALSVHPLTPHAWGVAFVLALLVIPLDMIRKAIIRK